MSEKEEKKIKKTVTITARVIPERKKAVDLLAKGMKVSPSEIISQSLPILAAAGLFLKVKNLMQGLTWDWAVGQGTYEFLITNFEREIRAHWKRIGLETDWEGMKSDSDGPEEDEIQRAQKKCLEELRAAKQDGSILCTDYEDDSKTKVIRTPLKSSLNPLQLHEAEADAFFLGRLYEAYQKAKSREPGFMLKSEYAPGYTLEKFRKFTKGKRKTEIPQTLMFLSIYKDGRLLRKE